MVRSSPLPNRITPLDVTTRERLARQPSKNTSPEIAIRRELWARGFRFSLHRPIPGTRRTIDIALVRHRVAVFVNGCFWHSCPRHGTTPRNNSHWWREKLARNVERDRETDRILRSQGWRVVRVWEHETPRSAGNRVTKVVLKKR
jgi:DNA mismatch endonuclease (patch repair protein)